MIALNNALDIPHMYNIFINNDTCYKKVRTLQDYNELKGICHVGYLVEATTRVEDAVSVKFYKGGQENHYPLNIVTLATLIY